MPAAWLNETTSIEEHGTAQQTAVIGIAPRAHWAVQPGGGRVLQEIVPNWLDGDANYPDVVSAAPLAVRSAGDGRYRIYPVLGDMARYIEIARPYTKPAATWQPLALGNRVRQGNRLLWTGSNVDLTVTMAGHYVGWEMPLKGGYVPPSSQFAVPMRLVGLTRSGARILADGVPVMLLRPPVVYDASNPLDIRPIEWQFGQIGGQTGVLFTLPDLTGMARPVVDPTLALQPDATAGLDTVIYSGAATNNYGLLDNIQGGTGGDPGPISRSLLQFDLSSIPGGTTVTSGVISLVHVGGVDSNAQTIALHRALTQWFEGAKSGAAPDAGQDGSTWNLRNANGAVAWAGGAGGGSGSDYAASATASVSVTGSATYGFTVTNDAAAWHAGTASNYGVWLLGPEASIDTRKNFGSSDHATAANRPLLTIVYRSGTPSGGIGRGRHGVLGRL